MGVTNLREDIFQIARKLAREFHLLLRVGYPEWVSDMQREGWCVPDYLFFDTHDIPLEERREMYTDFLRNLLPGCTELVTHPAEPTEELRAIGGMWQRRGFDLEFFSNPETRELIEGEGIVLLGYDRLLALTAERLGWY
jgi:chitin disaccharide deacetylase